MSAQRPVIYAGVSLQPHQMRVRVTYATFAPCYLPNADGTLSRYSVRHTGEVIVINTSDFNQLMGVEVFTP